VGLGDWEAHLRPSFFAQPDRGVRAVVAYIEKKPERSREDFTTIALDALRSKWPCR
jgi:hypothetical protein